MDPLPDYSLFLVHILEELDTKHNTMSYQDLCKSLCARFDLVHLVKLRSLLFYTACLDPSFPATLFKDKMRCSMENLQSKKLMVAADIITMFNLIQMNGGVVREKLPDVHQAKLRKNQSLDLCGPEQDAYKFQNRDRGSGYEHTSPRVGHHHHHHYLCHQKQPAAQSTSSGPKPSDSAHQFVRTSDPNFLLGFSRDPKCRAASLEKLQHLPQFSSISPPPPPCEMQSTYFPMDIDSESNTDQDSLQHISHSEPFSVHACIQKRNIFKGDFHNLVAFSPQVITTDCKQGSEASSSHNRRELHKPATFFNHSFELPYSNPYTESTLDSPLQDRQRVKHESLDDLQASTYFGPTTVSECVSSRKQSRRAGKQPAWPMKSLSLNTEEGPSDFVRSFMNGKPLKDNPHHNRSITSADDKLLQSPKDKVVVSLSGFAKKSEGLKTKEAVLMASGPVSLDKKEAAKRFRDKNTKSQSFQGGDIQSSVGTQTEQAEQKKVRDFRDRPAFKQPDEDSELVSDDISDIFRFLDDMSVCDSLGVVQPSCYNSNGSLSQVTLKSEGDSSPEHNTVKLAKSKLDHLFHSLENTDDELRSSVCKLVLRIGEIEKKLESLSGVRSEISQVLSKLNKLDKKIQEPESNGRHEEPASASGSTIIPDKLHPNTNLSPRVFPCNTTGHTNIESSSPGEWCCTDGSNSDSLRIKALKKSMFTRRSSHSLNEENSITESQVASITNSPRDWRMVSYSCQPADEENDKDRDSKDRHKKAKEISQDFSILHPEVSGKFTENWNPVFSQNIIRMAKKEKPADTNLDLQMTDKEGDIALLLLPILLPATPYKVGKKVFRPSSLKSRTAFIDVKPTEREHQYEVHQPLRPPKPPKESYLMEQVFSPHPYPPSVKSHIKGSPLYTELRISSLPDGKRGQPSWTIEEYKRSSGDKGKQLTVLDLQTQDSLNPNNLEYWMEDVYTPGFDSLLKKKEAEFRRAKACKIGALIAAATCTVVLVIVVPICTMKT